MLHRETDPKILYFCRENLRSAEVKNQRIMEAFKATSYEFREVVCQLTGYRYHTYRKITKAQWCGSANYALVSVRIRI
jgi:hypothetical protein